jgi:hypothetical protein
MKKVLLSLLAASLIFSSCEDLSKYQTENEELKKELEGYKNATVQDITFEGEEMIITFSNGAEYRTAAPESMTGEDGVGIANIEFDQDTGVLTITMTDGKTYSFQLNAEDSAVLISDTNGKYLLSKVTLGDVPVVEMTYTDDYQLKTVTNYITTGVQVLKTGTIERVYDANGNVTAINGKQYALENGWDYDQYYLNSYSEGVSFNSALNGNNDHFEANGDGTFTYYDFHHFNSYDSTFNYYKYDKAYYIEGPRTQWEVTVETEADTYIYFEFLTTENYLDQNNVAQERQWYIAEKKFIVHGQHEVGDLIEEYSVQVNASASGKIETVYDAATEADAYTKLVHSYNNDDMIIKTEAFYRNDSDEWVAEDGNISYAYNDDNLMTEATFTSTDTSMVVQKMVYDENNNPIEIWMYMDKFSVGETEVFDPTTGQYVDNIAFTREAGLHQVAEVEYKSNMKNFLGHTISALFPSFDGLKLNNAPARVVVSNTYLYGSMEYKNFNEGGYPEVISGYGIGGARIDLDLEYVKIEE